MKCLARSIITYNSQEELDRFLRNHPSTQLIVMDKNSLSIEVYFYIQLGIIKFSFVRIKPKNSSRFEATQSIDGGILLIDKAQVDLFLDKEPNNE
jgi:hypothetical protein